jgi:hypothetical protein
VNAWVLVGTPEVAFLATNQIKPIDNNPNINAITKESK